MGWGFAFGKYNAHLSLNMGKAGSAQADYSFWVLPAGLLVLWLVIALVIILILALLIKNIMMGMAKSLQRRRRFSPVSNESPSNRRRFCYAILTDMFSLGRNFLVFGVVLLFSLCALQGVQAARVHDISYSLAPSTVSVAANHTLIFQTKSVILSGTIRLHLKNVASSFGSIGVNDLDLSYGSSMAGSTQTQLALATTPTESSWTVSFDTANRIITFTYPSSGSATIPADQFVNIAIGTHASNQASGLNQMTNAATTGRKDAALFVGTDAHLFSVGLFSDAALSIPNVSYPASTQAETPAPPARYSGCSAHGGGTTQSQTQTNTQPIQPPTASQDSSTTEEYHKVGH